MDSRALIAPPPRATQAELARLLGVSRQAVGDLIKRNVLELGQDGKLDVGLARLALENRVRPSSKTAQAIASAQAAEPTAAKVLAEPSAEQAIQQADSASTQNTVTSYHVAKTIRETAEARLAQIRLQRAQNEVLDRDEALRAIQSKFRELRDIAMVLGRSLAPVLAAMTDPREIRIAIDRAQAEIFDGFVRRSLRPLANQLAGKQTDLAADILHPAVAPQDPNTEAPDAQPVA